MLSPVLSDARFSESARHYCLTWRSAELDNGIEVHTADLPRRRLVALRVIVWTLADGTQSGLPMVLARSIAQGPARCPPPEFSSQLESYGATVTVTAAPEAGVIDLTVPLSHLPAAAELLAEAVRAPALTADGVHQALARQRAAAEAAAHQPVDVVTRRFREQVYGLGPFQWPAEGTHSALDPLQPENVRAAYAASVSPGQVSVVATGDAESGRIGAAITHAFGRWGGDGRRRPGPVVVPALDPPALSLVNLPHTSQAVVACGRVVTLTTELEVAALVSAVHTLGGWFSSRLVRVLREEKGYTYGIKAECEVRRVPAGHVCEILIRASFSTPIAATAIREVFTQAALFANGDIVEQEWRRSVANLARSRVVSMTTGADVVRSYAADLQRGYPIDTLDRLASLAETVDLALVRRMTAKHLDPARFLLVVAGDAAQLQPGLESVVSRPVAS